MHFYTIKDQAPFGGYQEPVGKDSIFQGRTDAAAKVSGLAARQMIECRPLFKNKDAQPQFFTLQSDFRLRNARPAWST